MRIHRWLPLLALGAITAASCGGGDLGFGCPGADPAPPDVGGTWVYESSSLVTSSCSTSINQQLLTIFNGPCQVTVQQSGTQITTTDCQRRVATGCIDSSGSISVNEPLQAPVASACTLSSQVRLVADLSGSPTTGLFTLPITFSGSNCGVLTDCQAGVETNWVRTSATPTPTPTT